MEEGECVVLRLLVGERALGTADAWREALRTLLLLGQAHEDNSTALDTSAGSAPRSAAAIVVAAVETILPHLVDYKTFYENVSGLLTFCEQECLAELFNMVCRWLTVASTTSSVFRRWLYTYVNDASDTMMAVRSQQWKQAVLVAALQETDARLKTELLRLIDRRIGSLAGAVEARPPPSSVSSAHSELRRLLLFYWHHAEKLSQSSALCAAKVVALTRGDVAPTEETLALLRWGQVLEPLFFENFVGDLQRLQALRRSAELELRVPSGIEAFLHATAQPRAAALAALEASRQHLHSAAQRKVKYIYRSQDSPRANGMDMGDLSSVDLTIAHHVILYLGSDLALLPAEVFSCVFPAFVVAAASVLREQSGTNQTALDASKLIIRNLFGLLSLRTDSPCLLLLLVAIIDLHITSLPTWSEDPEVFSQVIDELSEAVVLEIDDEKRWVLHTALLQLVLECDATVLLDHSAFLAERLPHEAYDLVRHRLKK